MNAVQIYVDRRECVGVGVLHLANVSRWRMCKASELQYTVAESLIRDLGRVSEWCYLWGMKLNASKTKTMIVSWSRTMHPQSPPLTSGGTTLKESGNLVIL